MTVVAAWVLFVVFTASGLVLTVAALRDCLDRRNARRSASTVTVAPADPPPPPHVLTDDELECERIWSRSA